MMVADVGYNSFSPLACDVPMMPKHPMIDASGVVFWDDAPAAPPPSPPRTSQNPVSNQLRLRPSVKRRNTCDAKSHSARKRQKIVQSKRMVGSPWLLEQQGNVSKGQPLTNATSELSVPTNSLSPLPSRSRKPSLLPLQRAGIPPQTAIICAPPVMKKARTQDATNGSGPTARRPAVKCNGEGKVDFESFSSLSLDDGVPKEQDKQEVNSATDAEFCSHISSRRIPLPPPPPPPPLSIVPYCPLNPVDEKVEEMIRKSRTEAMVLGMVDELRKVEKAKEHEEKVDQIDSADIMMMDASA